MANPLSWLWRRKPQDNPVSAPPGEPEPYPTGFFRVVTISGQAGGLGFYCPRCRFSIRHSAPSTVFHCGRNETLDPQADLPVLRIRVSDQPRAIGGRVFVDPDAGQWDGTVEWAGSNVHRY